MFILEVFSNYNPTHILNLSNIKLIREYLRSFFLIYSILFVAVVPRKKHGHPQNKFKLRKYKKKRD
jgi:hypothetical protein